MALNQADSMPAPPVVEEQLNVDDHEASVSELTFSMQSQSVSGRHLQWVPKTAVLEEETAEEVAEEILCEHDEKKRLIIEKEDAEARAASETKARKQLEQQLEKVQQEL